MRLHYYRYWLVILLMAILAFNFVDRLALGVVLQDIKADLHLSDTQLGVLSGIAFALFYSVMGIPIARWADRGNRVLIISSTAALWSVAVALCGFAGTFTQLMLIRIGVAVGEAGAYAPGLSLVSGYFSRAERPRAIAIYSFAGPLAFVVGYSAAGWLSQRYGWRLMFMLLAVPGVVLAILARFILKEPRRETLTPNDISYPRSETNASLPWQPSLRDVWLTLSGNATFRSLLLCVSVQFFFTYGILQWEPTFFIRSFKLTSWQVGFDFAAICGAAGFLGNYLGGLLASRYAASNERAQLVAMAVSMVGAGVLSFLVYLSTSKYWALGFFGSSIVVQTAINGPLYATMQTLVPESMRAVSVALVMFFANLIGMGFGPLAAGALSDALQPWAGEEALRYALLMLAPGYFLVGWLAWRASQSVMRDIAITLVERHEGAATRGAAAN